MKYNAINLGYAERDQYWEAIARRLYALQVEIDELEFQKKLLKDTLQKLSEGVSSYHGSFAYIQSFRKGIVDYKKIPQLAGIDLEPYRKGAVESWKLVVIPEIK